MQDESLPSSAENETVVLFREGPIPSSPFFRLHPELRQIVYEFVFAITEARAFTAGESGLVHLRLNNFLSLLQTCRTIYWEARLVPFTANIFTPGSLCMRCTVRLLCSLRPWQAKALRGLKLDLYPGYISMTIKFSRLLRPYRDDHLSCGWRCRNMHYSYTPVAPLFTYIVHTMYPIYIHVRDKHDVPYRVIGPFGRESDWEEVLLECANKTIVVSGSSKLPPNV